ncbi:DMT family transporter [Microbacterium terricola]|uniref:DMT family transporter n=1 Tax=Microbacterium terricola TaxID=344163 RepID=UPI0021E85451|nr:DMT family transporter [Microbacterium terricola]UYK40966.1 DMT family transporter [Microbacterium terricola]
MEDNRLRWIAVTAIAPIAWGSTYVVTRQLLPPDAPLWGGVLRALPAGLIVLLLARRLPRGSWWWRSLVLGVLNVGGFFVLVYIAGQRLPSSLAATLMSTSALCMLLFAWLVLRRRPRAATVTGALIGVLGVVVMFGIGSAPADPWGVAASLGAMVASSLGFVLTVRWGADVPALPMTAWQLIAGSLVLVPVALLVEGAPPELTATSALGFAYVTVVATALAYVAWFTGLRMLSPGVVGVIGLLNPLTGVVLGVLVAGEPFGLPQAVGVGLVVVGVLVGVAPGRRSPGVRRAQRREVLADAPGDSIRPRGVA